MFLADQLGRMWPFFFCLANAPDASSDLEQILNVNRVAEEPSEHSAAAATQPESAGEVGPACPGEQIGWWVLDGGVGRRDVGLLAGLVVQQEEQAENVNGADGCQQTCGLLILGGTQRATNGEGAVQQIAESCTCFQAAEVWGDARAIQGKIVDQPLDEIAAVHRGCEVANAGVRNGSDGHGSRMLSCRNVAQSAVTRRR